MSLRIVVIVALAAVALLGCRGLAQHPPAANLTDGAAVEGSSEEDASQTDAARVDAQPRDAAPEDRGPPPPDLPVLCSCAEADVDQDGVVDYDDFMAATDCIKQQAGAACVRADCDGSGAVTAIEVVSIKKLADDGTCDPAPCGVGASATVYAANMMRCSRSNQSVPQCGAEQIFCRAGWHMCTATEFLDRGGKTMTTSPDAWLASCVRSGAKPHAPTDGICACTKGSATERDIEFECSKPGAKGTSSDAFEGVVAVTSCNKVGVSSSQPAHWKAEPSTIARPAAMCCR